jgi:hypothetical protein
MGVTDMNELRTMLTTYMSANNDVKAMIMSYDPTYKENYDKVMLELEDINLIRETFWEEGDIDIRFMKKVSDKGDYDETEYESNQGSILEFLDFNDYENWLGDQVLDMMPGILYHHLKRGNPDTLMTADRLHELQMLFKNKNQGQLFLITMLSLFGDDGNAEFMELCSDSYGCMVPYHHSRFVLLHK